MGVMYRPNPGFDWNPLVDMVKPNDKCVCGSEKKWKKCCKDRIPKVIPAPIARQIRNTTSIEAAVQVHDDGLEEFNKLVESKRNKEKVNEATVQDHSQERGVQGSDHGADRDQEPHPNQK
jgi:hypothetical protein